MRDLTGEELVMIFGADGGGFKVSAETAGGVAGGFIGVTFGGNVGAAVGGIIGAATGNYLTGTRQPGSVSTSGIPYGASMGGAYSPSMSGA